jgi:hypothetical protein
MAVDMLGVANIQGSGSLLNWVLGLPNDAYMPMLAIKDVSRGEHAKTEIGGIHPAQRKQMNEAKGVVWACNGIFNRVRAADLASFAREIGSVAGVMRQAAHNGNGIFRGLTQPLSVTRTGFGLEQDSFSIKSSNHEGLSFWDLKQLVGANAALMF